MDLFVHSSMHFIQRVHFLGSIFASSFSSYIAPVGQTSLHFPHLLQPKTTTYPFCSDISEPLTPHGYISFQEKPLLYKGVSILSI